MSDVITHIPMGADVPPWLLVLEPQGPNAVLRSFRFSTDVVVIDTPAFYVVIQEGPPAAGIMHIDGDGCILYAADKLVRVVNRDEAIFPHGQGVLQPIQQMVQFQPMTALPALPPVRPTLWQRIKRVWE